jgi:hypothetical protein
MGRERRGLVRVNPAFPEGHFVWRAEFYDAATPKIPEIPVSQELDPPGGWYVGGRSSTTPHSD